MDALPPRDAASEPAGPGDGDSFDAWFAANAAPVLLIDPERDGAIVDANPRAVAFYGHDRDHFRTLHVWDINALARDILPAMREIASWTGERKPQRFRHRRADGALRDVQVYAGPATVGGRRLLLCVIHDVTETMEMESFNRSLLDGVHVGVVGLNVEGGLTSVNPLAVRLLGFRHGSELATSHLSRCLPPAVEAGVAGHPIPDHPILDVARTGLPLLGHECALRRSDGVTFPARVFVTPILRGDRVEGAVMSFTDLSEEKEREALVRDLANALPGVVFQAALTDDGVLTPTYLSAGASTLLGLTPTEGRGSPADTDDVMRVIHPDDLPGARESMRRAAAELSPWEREFRVVGPGGERWLLGRAQPRSHPGGDVTVNGVLLDITERKRLEAELARAAMTDTLTGAWNRRHFEGVLEEANARWREPGAAFSLAMIDIDHFKRFNDRFGHQVGDEVLKTVTGVLSDGLRRGDRLARWGGEEFILALPDTGLDDAAALLERLRGAVEAVVLPTAGRVTVSAGIGTARPHESGDDLVRRVDDALYRAKETGRNRVVRAE